MRKIKEPNELAFNPRVSEECWNRNEALKYRSNQFWANIEVQETKEAERKNRQGGPITYQKSE